MKIGIDIDEVVVEFMKSYIEFHNKEKSTNFVLSKVTDYQLEKIVGLERKELQSLIKKFSESDRFDNLDFVKDSKENIFELEDGTNKIFFITSRHPLTKKRTIDFFERNFPKNNFEVIFSGENWGNLKTKGEICLDLGIEIMIEDNPKYAFDCASKGIKTFLLDKPWNKEYKQHENLIKVKDWSELKKHLVKLRNLKK